MRLPCLQRIRWFAIILFILFSIHKSLQEIESSKKDAIEKSRLSKTQYDKVMSLHKAWYNQAINNLLGVMGKDLISKLVNNNEKIALLQCLESIGYMNVDPKYPAQCLILTKDKKFKRVKRQSLRFRDEYHKKSENYYENNIIRQDSLKHLKSSKSQDSFVKKMSTFFTNIVSVIDPRQMNKKRKPWKDTYKKISKLNKILKAKNVDTDSSYKRVFDFVAEDQPTELVRVARSIAKPKSLETQFNDLIFTLEKHYTGKDNHAVLSPRIGSLLPSKYKAKQNRSAILSPNLFPLYQDESDPDSKYDILPIPKVMNELGMNEKDKEHVLEMIMDITGAGSIVEDVENVLRTNKLGDDIEAITNFVSNSFLNVQKNFNIRQKRDMEKNKYSFLSVSQLKEIYDKNGPYYMKRSEFPFSIGEYKKMTMVDKKRSLWETVRLISEIPDPLANMRGGTAVFNAYVFSPYVLSPNVINPYVLSPVILSPFVLCPDVLSPTVLSGVILSPSVLSPAVFTDSILAANVLSPSFLS
uniref:Exported protein n=1 Tax=Parastrongyloides trichosuri TaxID=131310 RepID=A0A0N4ZW32_PARTI